MHPLTVIHIIQIYGRIGGGDVCKECHDKVALVFIKDVLDSLTKKEREL